MWKAERREPEVNNISPVEEVLERKLWSAEKITIPAGSAKLVKVRTEGNWKGAGVVELLPLEDQGNVVIPGVHGLLQRFYSMVLGFDQQDEQS